MGANDSTVHKMDLPLDMDLGICFHLKVLKKLLPQAILAPLVEAAVDGLPRAVPFGQVTPWRPGFQNPADAVDDLAMAFSRPPYFRFLG